MLFCVYWQNVSDSNGLNLKNCKEVKVLGITTDRNLNFKGHIKNISRKAGQKLSALPRISSHINTAKKSLQINDKIPVRLLSFSVDVLL